LVVNSERKERWDDVAENDTQYTSLSDLIRTSVESQINTDGSEREKNSASMEVLDALSNFSDKIDDIEGEVEEVSKQINAVENSIDEVGVKRLGDIVFQTLPEAKFVQVHRADDPHIIPIWERDSMISDGSISDICNILSVPRTDVKRALGVLSETTDELIESEIDGNAYWLRSNTGNQELRHTHKSGDIPEGVGNE
jgi:seryl-tRNA synthetase